MPPLALLLCALAHANPIACEQRGEIGIAEDGHHVWARFLGLCDSAAGYDDALAVQYQGDDEDGWTVIESHWVRTGTEEAEGGSGLESYSVFEQTVACPDEGNFEFRVAWINPDGAEGWFGQRIACEGPGSGCAALPSDGRCALALCGLALVGLALRRRHA
jgi:hypothetical protein